MDNLNETKEKPKRIFLLGFFRRYFFAGVASVLPVLVTIYAIVIVFNFTDRFAGKYINNYLSQNYGYSIPGLGFIVTLLFFVLIGFVSSHFIDKRILPFFEKLLGKIPIVSSIYPSVKRLSEFLFGSGKSYKFKKVVLVPYPNRESFAIGFITNENSGSLNQKTGKDLITVFMPLAPTPFSGFILFIPKQELKFLNISIDLAIRCIVSGGVIPPSRD